MGPPTKIWSSLKTPGTHQQGLKKVYYLHNGAFWGEESRHPKQVQKWPERTEKRDWFGVLIMIKGQCGKGLLWFDSPFKERNT